MASVFYMDHHIPKAITAALQQRGVDVLSAFEDGASELEDASLLNRATELGRALVTNDRDLLIEATRRLRSGEEFGGVIYVRLRRLSLGDCIGDLELIAKSVEFESLRNNVIYVPI